MSQNCSNIDTAEPRVSVQQPAYTTREDESGVHLQIALPGVAKDGVKLTVKDGILSIQADRTTAVPDDWKTHSAGNADISYQLNLRLTRRLDGSEAKAALENGVLTLDIPIREEAKPRQISVN